jgi:hypothetical protein
VRRVIRKPIRKAIRVIRETQEPGESVQRRLLVAGGVNRFGEANFRAVWGWNRLAWMGGKFEDRDENTGEVVREVVKMRFEPKYPQVNRWHIERWLPPEIFGSPERWYGQTTVWEEGKDMPLLGPYPWRGEYESCFVLEDARGNFVQLTATIAEMIAGAINYSRNGRRAASRAALYAREAKADLEYENWAFDVLDDAVPAFHKQPFVTVA